MPIDHRYSSSEPRKAFYPEPELKQQILDLILKLVKKRYSYPIITKMVNERFGTDFSTNAVIGRYDRYISKNGLKKPGTLRINRKYKAKDKPLKPSAGGQQVIFVQEASVRTELMEQYPVFQCTEETPHVTFEQLKEKHCRWPLLKNGETVYCGNTRMGSYVVERNGRQGSMKFRSAYCAYHQSRSG